MSTGLQSSASSTHIFKNQRSSKPVRQRVDVGVSEAWFGGAAARLLAISSSRHTFGRVGDAA